MWWDRLSQPFQGAESPVVAARDPTLLQCCSRSEQVCFCIVRERTEDSLSWHSRSVELEDRVWLIAQNESLVCEDATEIEEPGQRESKRPH